MKMIHTIAYHKYDSFQHLSIIFESEIILFNNSYPWSHSLFQWYPQSNEILSNLSMKCWNAAFTAQGWRVFIIVVQVGAGKIYVAAMERPGKSKEGMKLSLPPKLVEKLVWVPVISFLSYAFDALLCPNWPFSPPNRLVLRMTLIFENSLIDQIHPRVRYNGWLRFTGNQSMPLTLILNDNSLKGVSRRCNEEDIGKCSVMGDFISRNCSLFYTIEMMMYTQYQ
jgi:hypothetical protein